MLQTRREIERVDVGGATLLAERLTFSMKLGRMGMALGYSHPLRVEHTADSRVKPIHDYLMYGRLLSLAMIAGASLIRRRRR